MVQNCLFDRKKHKYIVIYQQLAKSECYVSQVTVLATLLFLLFDIHVATPECSLKDQIVYANDILLYQTIYINCINLIVTVFKMTLTTY